MHDTTSIVIVGAGLAGGTAAATLRAEGFAGRIVLVGDETYAPYERPALSKGYLTGATSGDAILTRPLATLIEDGIETRFGDRVTRLDVAGRQVVLAGGERLPYDRLLLATGSRNRRPPVPGLDLPGVHDLRTRSDADALRAEATTGRRAVVLGMGFVGSEVAAALRGLDLEVTVVEQLAAPLAHVLGDEVSEVIRSVHEEHGVRMLFGERVTALTGDDRVRSVQLASGTSLACDLVVFGFGSEPVMELAAEAGLAVADGIVVDELGRTSVPGVFAAGDAASHRHPILDRHVRVEHWQNAVLQSRVVAQNMLGASIAYSDVHWFWSDQYDVHIHYAGFHEPWDERVVRGSVAERRFAVFYLAQGRLVAAAAVNMPLLVRQAMTLIAARAQVTAAELADPSVKLATLRSTA